MNFKSYAKINLNLFVVGRRNDGYHLLQSIFYPLKGVADEIVVKVISKSSADADQVVINKLNYIEDFQDSLIAKAIDGMRDFCGFQEKFQITLNKKIPIGAGLGGGSSNAGTIINAIDEMLNLDLALDQKIEIAAKIGADVPFFITNTCSIVEGVGDKVLPIQNHKNFNILIITPNFTVDTPEVYHEYKLWNANGKMPFSPRHTHLDLLDEGMIGVNDLQPMVEFKYPAIKELLHDIGGFAGCQASAISGSGSSCFGVFDSVENLKNASEFLNKQYPDYQIFECN